MSQPKLIRVILIDDHSWVHEIISKILQSEPDIQLVAQGSNGTEALQLCDQVKPDIVLLDVVMPVTGGVEATIAIRQKYPEMKILVVSSFRDDDSVRAMLENGAVGYVLKDSLNDDLANTIRATYTGKAVFSTEVSRLFLKPEKTITPQNFGLTQREREILSLMAGGLNNAQIAQKLVISQSTVKFHLSNVLYKMGVETRAEAIVRAAKNDLL